MEQVDASLRLRWFETVLDEGTDRADGHRPVTVRPAPLQVDDEMDQLERALVDLVSASNAAAERQSLMTSVQIVDGWYRSAGRGAYVMPGDDGARRPSLSELAYQLLEWKRRETDE